MLSFTYCTSYFSIYNNFAASKVHETFVKVDFPLACVSDIY